MEKKRQGKGGKWRKSETREEIRGKGRETTFWHFELSAEWFGSTCGFDCYCKEGKWIDLVGIDLVILCRFLCVIP